MFFLKKQNLNIEPVEFGLKMPLRSLIIFDFVS